MEHELDDLNILVIGLGSMGKRRIRNLRSLGIRNIFGYDQQAARCDSVTAEYSIRTFRDFDEAIDSTNPKALIISVWPESHMFYAWKSFELGISCFIEASVVDPDGILGLWEALMERPSPSVIVPSCTMRYFPGPRKVKEILKSRRLGKLLTFNYHVGQYLPDWHPWEDISSYYVSRRQTGGCRELVPFELTWLNDLFGYPEPLTCIKLKLSDMQADIDDFYQCALAYPDRVLANLTVEVISRPVPTRELRMLFSDGELVMSSDERVVRFIGDKDDDWTRFEIPAGVTQNGYINPEEPYILEMADFVKAVQKKNPSLFPNSLNDDWRVLKLLENLDWLSSQIATRAV